MSFNSTHGKDWERLREVVWRPSPSQKTSPALMLSTPAEHFDRHPTQARQETGLKSIDPHAGPSEVSRAINLPHDQHVAELLRAEVDSGVEGDSGAFTKRRLTSESNTGPWVPARIVIRVGVGQVTGWIHGGYCLGNHRLRKRSNWVSGVGLIGNLIGKIVGILWRNKDWGL
ncbi:uncharacterized protein LOC126623983 isoform X2 [Malus sylvestris]|uniref:uncharacterized protein LOC126623983 isoform X1 n=1 Tax=Malus sylvestris TaxID=3752 RepID=UPI0021AC5B61|nr:uncharacterized protein LOC126623983 isoform X1 [Malus sylvestris]XP_050148929.1 uncharacterized protein LOC126623983 isoform X2 [Malus sylvestris]